MLRLSTYAVVGAIMASNSALAQDAASAPYFATVTADNVYVRSGPSVQSSYPFGKVARGDVVRVSEESFGWARVNTTGPAFDNIFGYISADKRVDAAADGTTVRATAHTEVRAPNVGADSSPDSSWKQIGALEAGDTANLIGTVEGERESVFKIKLPATAEGWINVTFLRTATPGEVTAMQTGGKAAAPADVTTVAGDPAAEQDPSAEVVVLVDEPSEPGVAVDIVAVTPRAPLDPQAAGRAAARAAFEVRRATLADLEAIWSRIKLEPEAEAEIETLRGRYLDLATTATGDQEVRARANGRAEQLKLRMEVQSRIREIGQLRARLTSENETLASAVRALEARSDYTNVGVLNASIVYDGDRLPLLYRLQDPSTGQAVAYVIPGPDFQLSLLLGNLIGIRGEVVFDEALKVNILSPRTIDVLTARLEATPAPTEAAAEPAATEPAATDAAATDAAATEAPAEAVVESASTPPAATAEPEKP